MQMHMLIVVAFVAIYCITVNASIVPNSNRYCSKLNGTKLEACNYGIYVGSHPEQHLDLANEKFPLYCKGMCEKKNASIVFALVCGKACEHAGGKNFTHKAPLNNTAINEEKVKIKELRKKALEDSAMEKATEQKAKNLLRLPEENEKKSLQEKKKMNKLEIKYKEEVEKKIKEAEIKHKIAVEGEEKMKKHAQKREELKKAIQDNEVKREQLAKKQAEEKTKYDQNKLDREKAYTKSQNLKSDIKDKMMKNRVNETNTELTTVEEEHKQLVEKNNTENEEFEKDEKNTTAEKVEANEVTTVANEEQKAINESETTKKSMKALFKNYVKSDVNATKDFLDKTLYSVKDHQALIGDLSENKTLENDTYVVAKTLHRRKQKMMTEEQAWKKRAEEHHKEYTRMNEQFLKHKETFENWHKTNKATGPTSPTGLNASNVVQSGTTATGKSGPTGESGPTGPNVTLGITSNDVFGETAPTGESGPAPLPISGPTGTFIRSLTGKLVIKSLQNHVLNVTGLPDLDRALLQNPTIKKVLGGISENNKVKTNLLIMNHMKKGVHPNKLFPHHDAHEEHLNSIQDVIKHMKKEDLDDGFTGKRTTGATGSNSPKDRLLRTKEAVKQLLSDVQEANEHDMDELAGFGKLRHLFKKHLQEQQKINNVLNSGDAHTDIQNEMKSADEHANSAIRKLNRDADNLLDGTLIRSQQPTEEEKKTQAMEQSPSVQRIVAEFLAALQNSENLANKDIIDSQQKSSKIFNLKTGYQLDATNSKLCKWLKTTSFCNEEICPGQCEVTGKIHKAMRKECTLKYNKCLMNEKKSYEHCLHDVMECNSHTDFKIGLVPPPRRL